jgi:hypothetical protein
MDRISSICVPRAENYSSIEASAAATTTTKRMILKSAIKRTAKQRNDSGRQRHHSQRTHADSWTEREGERQKIGAHTHTHTANTANTAADENTRRERKKGETNRKDRHTTQH